MDVSFELQPTKWWPFYFIENYLIFRGCDRFVGGTVVSAWPVPDMIDLECDPDHAAQYISVTRTWGKNP